MSAIGCNGLILSPGLVDDDSAFELFAEVQSGEFRGVSSAWFSRTDLNKFAAQLIQTYPLQQTVPLELCGGYIFSVADAAEPTHLRIRFYPVGRRGTIGCGIQLATPTAEHERPESQHRIAVEILTTYEDMSRFGRQLKELVKSGTGEAKIEAGDH